jgi:CheY-like chemotaxis protein
VIDDDPVVLVAEDEPALADLYAHWLRDWCRPRIVRDGAAAIETFDASIDVALLDRRLPGHSGDEVLEHIREHTPTCPVGMVTATTPELTLIDQGVDAVLTKPVRRETVTDVISTLVALHDVDPAVRRHYRLSSSLTAVESNRAPSALSDDTTYQALCTELDALETQLETTLAD